MGSHKRQPPPETSLQRCGEGARGARRGSPQGYAAVCPWPGAPGLSSFWLQPDFAPVGPGRQSEPGRAEAAVRGVKKSTRPGPRGCGRPSRSGQAARGFPAFLRAALLPGFKQRAPVPSLGSLQLWAPGPRWRVRSSRASPGGRAPGCRVGQVGAGCCVLRVEPPHPTERGLHTGRGRVSCSASLHMHECELHGGKFKCRVWGWDEREELPTTSLSPRSCAFPGTIRTDISLGPSGISLLDFQEDLLERS